MAGRRYVQCVGPSGQLADRKAGIQRSVNLYPAAVESPGEEKAYVLKQCPGFSGPIYTDIGGFEARALLSSIDGDVIHFVDGDTLRSIHPITQAITTFTNILNSSSGRVRMVLGNGVIVLVDGVDGYVANIAGATVTRITDADWRGSTQVEFLDGYFIFAEPGTDQFYISAIDDASSLDALDFSSADRLPDNIIAMRVNKQQLYIFGNRSVEIWINTGGSDFPFARYTSAAIDVGIVGAHAAVKTTDSLFFIGRSASGQSMVFDMAGNTPKRVSTRAVEETMLAVGSDLSLAWMWTYQAAGGEFVGIEVPGARTTWVYDIATGLWHERCRRNVSDGDLDAMGIVDVVTVGGIQVVAYKWNESPNQWLYVRMSDAANSYYLNSNLALAEMSRERTWPHLVTPSAEMQRYASLELACTTGHGGSVTLEISNDGGNTWGAPLLRSLGATGRYMERVRWLGLGQARDRVFRLRCTDDVPFNIHGAQVEMG